MKLKKICYQIEHVSESIFGDQVSLSVTPVCCRNIKSFSNGFIKGDLSKTCDWGFG